MIIAAAIDSHASPYLGALLRLTLEGRGVDPHTMK
jgi:hypothetical protein